MKATIQVDLDGLWTYERYLGREFSRQEVDPVYSEGAINFLKIFREYSVKATFFIIGNDAAHPLHQQVIRRIVEEGHEIANHTMTHPLNFNRLGHEVISDEIKRCDEILRDIIGAGIKGFRAPTFSINENMLKLLTSLGYLYDSSVVPSFVLPFNLMLAHSLLGRRFKKIAGGGFRFGMAPLTVYKPDEYKMHKTGTGDLYEFPVSVVPFLRLPLHSTYVFMSGAWLFDLGFSIYKAKQACFNYLFHGIDLIDVGGYGLKIPLFGSLERRRRISRYIVAKMKDSCNVMRTQDVINTMRGTYDFCSASRV